MDVSSYLEFSKYLEMAMDWVVKSGPRILFIVILMFICLKLSKVISRRLFLRLQKNKDEEYQKRAETLNAICQVVLSIIIAVVGLMIILSELGVKMGPILASAGIVGLAVGFGAQNLVQDVISGFFLLIEDQVRVGDVVQVAGKSGLVEKVGLRMIILRDLAGNVHYVSNGKVDIITNMSKEYSRYVFDIGVAYKEDVDEVIEIIKQVDEDMRNDLQFKDDILEPIEILGLDQFADSAVIVRARTKTKPIKQWSIGREFNKRLKKRFDQVGIEIPFPHRTVYFGEDKEARSSH